MKSVAILTSSRADYGIYLPLLKALDASESINMSIIVFGTHLSAYHGSSMNNILEDGFKVDHEIEAMLLHDTPNAISTAIGLSMVKFADFWKEHGYEFDLVFCLGDRYEMFAAVYSGIPFRVKFAHIHGGETTLGAIDNIYRHAISLTSNIHFTSTQSYAQKVRELTGSNKVYVCGSLSLDSLKDFKLYSIKEFKGIWSIDLSKPSILITLHPETIDISVNNRNLKCFIEVLSELRKNYSLVITMPNADTEGSKFRQGFIDFKSKYKKGIYLIENFGTKAFFTCMEHSAFLLGNSSSGIIEAASFGKYVLNIGVRQKGRAHGENVITLPFDKKIILDKAKEVEQLDAFHGKNIYDQGGAVKKIMKILKNEIGV